jgi:excisionase family DNA binding protein
MVIRQDILPLLTIGHVSRVLHVHTNTIRRWSDQGILKSYRIGSRGDRRFDSEDISRFQIELKVSSGNAKVAARFNNLQLIDRI